MMTRSKMFTKFRTLGAVGFLATLLLPIATRAFDAGQFRGTTSSQSCQELNSSWTPNWSYVLGYWPMNCAIGTTYNGASTTYVDLSPNPRPMISQTALTCSAGVNEQALTFAGSGQYAKVAYDAGLQPTSVSNAAWMKFSSFSVSGESMIISTFESGGYGIELSENGSNLTFSVNVAGTYYYAKYPTSNLSLNTWYHVVGTFDNANLKLYVNSALVAITAASGSIRYTNNTPVCIGQDASATSCDTSRPSFPGSLDDVTIWGTALSWVDVQKLYYRSNCDQLQIPQRANAVGLWHLNDAAPGVAATSFNDSIGSNHLSAGGTFYGAPGKFGFNPVTTSNTTYLYKDGLSGMPSSGNKTIAMWFKFTSSTFCQTALCNFGGYGNPNVNGQNFQVGTGSSGKFVVWGWGGSTWDWDTAVGTAAYMDGNWHHIAVTYATGSPNTTKLYLDGVEKATTGSYTYSPNPQYIVLGNEVDKSGQWFGGSLAEFAIWSVTLSAADVLELAQKTFPIRY